MRAGLVAAAVSGTPSTAYALATGRDPLEATKAAGALIVGDDAPGWAQLAAAVPVHAAISLFWAATLERALPRRHRIAWGAAGGLAIAAVDLGVIGRRSPAMRRLPLVPQLADHALFGAIVGALSPLDKRYATGSRSTRIVRTSSPTRRTIAVFRRGSVRGRGSSPASTCAVPARQRPRTQTRTRGFASMFLT